MHRYDSDTEPCTVFTDADRANEHAASFPTAEVFGCPLRYGPATVVLFAEPVPVPLED